MTRAVVVYNPVAGSAMGHDIAEKAEQHLRSLGHDVRTIATLDRSGAAEIARSVASDVDLLIVAGGDGSLREAIEGLGDERGRVVIGFLPVGHANVAARELGIPTDRDEAVRLLDEGVATPVDLGVVRANATSRLFLAMVGIGWDALTVYNLDRLRHTRIGARWYRLWADSAYIICGLLAVFQLRQPKFRILVDAPPPPSHYTGGHYAGGHFCNFNTYAKGASIAPDAHFRSGRLHYQARKRAMLPALVWHLLAANARRKVPAFISDYGEGTRFGMRADREIAVQVDGDFLGFTTELDVEILPGAVRILMPSSSSGTSEEGPDADSRGITA